MWRAPCRECRLCHFAAQSVVCNFAGVTDAQQKEYLQTHSDRTIGTVLLLVGELTCCKMPKPPPVPAIGVHWSLHACLSCRRQLSDRPCTRLPTPPTILVFFLGMQPWRPRHCPWWPRWAWRPTRRPSSRPPRPATAFPGSTAAPACTWCALVRRGRCCSAAHKPRGRIG